MAERTEGKEEAEERQEERCEGLEEAVWEWVRRRKVVVQQLVLQCVFH